MSQPAQPSEDGSSLVDAVAATLSITDKTGSSSADGKDTVKEDKDKTSHSITDKDKDIDSEQQRGQAELDKDAVDSIDQAAAAAGATELFPRPAMYCPCNIRGLVPGEKKLWCTCGLSKKQPWCDGAHAGTDFKPLRWTVPERQQAVFQLCACKYTKSPPYCDATHTNLPLQVLARQRDCPDREKTHSGADKAKLCSSCGYAPDCSFSSLRVLVLHGAGRRFAFASPSKSRHQQSLLSVEQCEAEARRAHAELLQAAAALSQHSATTAATAMMAAAAGADGGGKAWPAAAASGSLSFFHSNSEASLIDRLYSACDEDIHAALLVPGNFVNGYPALAAALHDVSEHFPTIALLPNMLAEYMPPPAAIAAGGLAHFLPHRCSNLVAGGGLSVYATGFQTAQFMRRGGRRKPSMTASSATPPALATLSVDHPTHLHNLAENESTTPTINSASAAVAQRRTHQVRPSSVDPAALEKMYPAPTESFYQPQSQSDGSTDIPSWLVRQLQQAALGPGRTETESHPHPFEDLERQFSGGHTNPQHFQKEMLAHAKSNATSTSANSTTDRAASQLGSALTSSSPAASPNRSQSVHWEDDFAETIVPSITQMNSARQQETKASSTDQGDFYIDELFFPQLYGKDTR
ncbi:hypothetical protein CAOG_00400 [Capsaspora owczarzaki ATCC 30864]|uniref:Iron-binding zinc finger CDGSH type domain-containing protein n=1 Tax=Capsaspora owczarzaki (strain ATCC 30864) TaxID=595528 RepID=A0A0D2X0C5_CAPO3|nr:hypothetical protein CAOG_00400 [Capsaspora owczarzaki ATCC 30864]KJE88819.1 hypothetical protein CAOG_000400 [Capsaspora owczarzaki ATCC 30864]|eukprot:XP_004365271.1 hypothetical protein CAOG_00400 [Capsaspora owczarzaki ATCC 30864]